MSERDTKCKVSGSCSSSRFRLVLPEYNRPILLISAAACESHHPKGANYLTVELAGLKEMTQDLADLLGLAIPVNLFQLSHSF